MRIINEHVKIWTNAYYIKSVAKITYYLYVILSFHLLKYVHFKKFVVKLYGRKRDEVPVKPTFHIARGNQFLQLWFNKNFDERKICFGLAVLSTKEISWHGGDCPHLRLYFLKRMSALTGINFEGEHLQKIIQKMRIRIFELFFL